MPTTVTTRTIHGVKVEVRVTEKGKFIAHIDEGDLGDHEFEFHDTLDDAVADATRVVRQATKRAKAKTEVTIVDAQFRGARDRWSSDELWTGYSNQNRALGLFGLVDCIYRGRNNQRRYKDSYLITVGARKLQFNKNGGGTQILRRLTEAERAEYERLSAAMIAAHQAMEDFQAPLRLDLKALDEGEIKLLTDPPRRVVEILEED